MRVKELIQHDESDCGAACLAIILSFYGRETSIRKIREAAGTDKVGTSGYGIQEGAKKFGLDCKGLFCSEKEKVTEIPLPAILHFNKDGSEHYVVIYKVKKDFVYISDPAKGLRKIKKDELFEYWSGIFFVLYPSPKFVKKSDKKGNLIRFFSLLKPYKKLVIQIILSSVMLSLFGVFMSFYFRFLIDEVLYSQVKSTLNLCSVSYLFVVICQTVMGFCRSSIIMYLGAKIDVSLVCDFYMHLLKLPMDFFSKRKTGEILSRLSDVSTIKNAISSTSLGIVIDSVMIFVGGFFLIKMGSSLLPAAVVPVVLSSIVVFIFARPFRYKIREHAVLEAEKNACVYESINGIATIKGLATEEKAFERAEERIVEAAKKMLSLSKLGNAQNAIQGFISSCGTLALYWYGSFLIFQNQMSLGQLISFITLSGFFLGPLSRLLTMQSYWQEVFVSAERLSDILDMDEENLLDDSKEDVENLLGDIEFKKVCFSYGTRGRAIENVSLKIPAGKKVAFVGMSGSGKTTLLKLLMKFYKLESGEIRINNTNIEDYKTDSYREKIGYVPQESLLFSGTIEENIGWGSVNPSREQIVVAAANAQALNFIDSLPDKFRTIVGEQGATLSGGERQRIALARVLMRNPHFLILDEATASLDSISEHEIMETIYKKIKKRTVIMVAHRLSTIRQCDLIYVFEKGKLLEVGNHDQLIKKGKKYAQLWRAQNEKSSDIKAS